MGGGRVCRDAGQQIGGGPVDDDLKAEALELCRDLRMMLEEFRLFVADLRVLADHAIDTVKAETAKINRQ